MKSLEYVKEHIDEIEQDHFLGRRFTVRFLDFVPVKEWESFGFAYAGDPGDEPAPKAWTEENILAQLKDDVEFGIEKSINHRGISAGLMYECIRAWCVVLENGLEDIGYGWYGDELLKAVDAKYNFGLVTEDTFDEEFYGDWS